MPDPGWWVRAISFRATRWLAALTSCVLASACRDEARPGTPSVGSAARVSGAADTPCICDDVSATGACGHVALGHYRRRALLLEPGSKLSLALDGGTARA